MRPWWSVLFDWPFGFWSKAQAPVDRCPGAPLATKPRRARLDVEALETRALAAGLTGAAFLDDAPKMVQAWTRANDRAIADYSPKKLFALALGELRTELQEGAAELPVTPLDAKQILARLAPPGPSIPDPDMLGDHPPSPPAPWLMQLLTTTRALHASDPSLTVEQFVDQVEFRVQGVERPEREMPALPVPAPAAAPAAMTGGVMCSLADAAHGAATTLLESRLAKAADTGLQAWFAGDYLAVTPMLPSGTWIVLQNEAAGVGQTLAAEHAMAAMPSVLVPSTLAGVLQLPTAPWLAEVLTTAGALRAADPSLAFEQLVDRVEVEVHDAHARVLTFLQSPWMAAAATAALTIVAQRLAARRSQPPLEMPGITSPVEST